MASIQSLSTSEKVLRLEHEFNQLRSATPARAADSLSNSLLSSSSARSPDASGIGLQELLEREIKAQAALTGTPQTTSPHSSQASPGLPASGRMLRELLKAPDAPQPQTLVFQTSREVQTRSREDKATCTEWNVKDSYTCTECNMVDKSTCTEGNDLQKMQKMSELYAELEDKAVELEDMDTALQQACQANIKLTGEKDACVVAHARDVASLEHMLKAVMDENAQLKGALRGPKGKPSKLDPRSMPHSDLISSLLIQSGISYTPSTPTSIGSSSTQTPPIEPAASEGSLDMSRASVPSMDVTTMIRCD